MKRLFPIFLILLFLTSCQTRVVSAQKSIQPNSLELYQKYTIQTNDAQLIKMEVLRQDNEKVYGKLKTGEEVIVEKSNIREAKKVDVLSSVAIGLAALAAVIFVPI